MTDKRRIKIVIIPRSLCAQPARLAWVRDAAASEAAVAAVSGRLLMDSTPAKRALR